MWQNVTWVERHGKQIDIIHWHRCSVHIFVLYCHVSCANTNMADFDSHHSPVLSHSQSPDSYYEITFIVLVPDLPSLSIWFAILCFWLCSVSCFFFFFFFIFILSRLCGLAEFLPDFLTFILSHIFYCFQCFIITSPANATISASWNFFANYAGAVDGRCDCVPLPSSS